MGAFDPLTKLVCLIAYGLFCFTGLILLITGGWYKSEVPGANDMVMFSLVGGGIGMMAIGGLALWSVFKHHRNFLWVVWVADIVLFVVVTVGAVIGIVLGMDVQDPSRHAINLSFSEVLWRETFWDGNYCQTHSSSTHCTSSFLDQAKTQLAATDANYTTGDTVRHLFGDCNYAKLGVACEVSVLAGDTALCIAVDLVTGTEADQAAICNGVTGGQGCVFAYTGDDSPAVCNGDNDGSGAPATCAGTATVPTCDASAAVCPSGCASTAAVTPACAFADAAAVTGCPDGCTEDLTAGAEECTGTASTTPGTCTGTATAPTCDAAATDAAGCATGCAFTPRGPGTTCSLTATSSACAVEAGNCVYAAFQAASPKSCTVKPDCAAQDALYASCTTCATDCREALISDVKTGMKPAYIVMLVACFFSVIGVTVNHYIVTHDPEGGIMILLALVFNGLVAFSGLVVAIVSAVGQMSVVEECPAEGDCTNLAAIFAIIIGMLLFVVGMLGFLGTKFGVHFFMTITNAVHSLLAFGLLVTGVFVAIVAGEMETINAKSEHHFDDLRSQYESQYPDYCSTTTNDGSTSVEPVYTPMETVDCRNKMKSEIEDNMLTLGSALVFVACGFIVTMYFTWAAIGMLADDDDDTEYAED